MVVLIPDGSIVSGFIKILSEIVSLFTITEASVPIPEISFDWRFNFIVSPVNNLWYVAPGATVERPTVEIDTTEFILWTLDLICVFILSNRYSSLSLPLLRKNTSSNSDPIPVLMPTELIVFLTMYTVVVTPDIGKLNGVPVGEVEIDIAPPVGTVKLTGWFVANGWFSI